MILVIPKISDEALHFELSVLHGAVRNEMSCRLTPVYPTATQLAREQLHLKPATPRTQILDDLECCLRFLRTSPGWC